MSPADQRRLVEALEFALCAHGGQTRKGGDNKVPYASHLLQVAGLVQEHGGDIEQALAALLHDTVEDCDQVHHETLVERFGETVAMIVRDCTDTQPDEKRDAKRPWRERKLAYLAHLEHADERSLLVSVCDKRHNLGATVADLEQDGLDTFSRFNSSADEQLWYYERIVDLTRGRVPTKLHYEFELLLGRLQQLLAR